MISIPTTCPDCKEAVNGKKIELDQCGNLYWMCPFCGTVHFANKWVRRLCSRQSLEFVLTHPESHGRYMFDTGIEVIGVENLDGKIITEEFLNTMECLGWFVGKQNNEDCGVII